MDRKHYVFELYLLLVFYIYEFLELVCVLLVPQVYLLQELGVEVERVGRDEDSLYHAFG